MSWMASKLFLKTESSELCERIIKARHEQPNHSVLHDAIEDDPEYAGIIAAIDKEVELEVRQEIGARNALCGGTSPEAGLEDWPRGTCHRFWKLKRDRLLEKGIIWYSPKDLNPGCIFD